MLNDKLIDQTKIFFFRAMLQGYISDNPRHNDFPYHGWKAVEYREGSFFFTQMWHSNDEGESGGVTTIYYEHQIIWEMYFQGWYAREVIPHLKLALWQAYTKGLFNGARGPNSFVKNNYTYINEPNLRFNEITRFMGSEKILTVGKQKLMGTHWYRGGWMSHS